MTTMSMASATGAPYTVTSATASRSIEVLTMPDDTSIVFVVGKPSCCQGGGDVLCPHGIAVSNSEVLERLDHFLLRGFGDS